MKYYALSCATKKIGRGRFPQARGLEMRPGKTVNDPDFAWNIPFDKSPDFIPYIGTIILANGASRTDFISSGLWDFVCSDKVMSVIHNHNCGQTNFYDMGIKHKNVYYYNYKLMHCVNNYADQIDYEQSEFQKLKVENNKWVGEICPVKNVEEVIELRKELAKNEFGDWYRISPFKIRFRKGFVPEFDIFKIWGASFHLFISQKLKDAFDVNKINGVQYDFDMENIEFSITS